MPFTWHAVSATDNYDNLKYPAILNDCQQCHLPGTYDFSATGYNDTLRGNMLDVLDAKGTYDPAGSTAYRNSPYITQDTAVSSGTGWAIDIVTGIVTEGSPTNLVSTPITATCATCHDSMSATAHMETNGGSFYEPRATAGSAKTEACLNCHGKGKDVAIDKVHAY